MTENTDEELKQEAKFQISEHNIQADGQDDSEVLIKRIQETKLNLIRDLYEIFGLDLGDNNTNVEVRNYLIDNPIKLNGISNDIILDMDLSNYTGGLISVDKLLQIFPRAKKEYAIAALAALEKYGTAVGLTDKGKLMVLAQFAVESGQFIYTSELGKGKGKKYGQPAGPYNKLYYGRGPIQITWEQNYKQISQQIFPQMGINADIWTNPDLCETNLLIGCAASLAWFLLSGNGKRAVQCANNGDVNGLSKAINGGWNSIEHRREYTQKIFASI